METRNCTRRDTFQLEAIEIRCGGRTSERSCQVLYSDSSKFNVLWNSVQAWPRITKCSWIDRSIGGTTYSPVFQFLFEDFHWESMKDNEMKMEKPCWDPDNVNAAIGTIVIDWHDRIVVGILSPTACKCCYWWDLNLLQSEGLYPCT